jgi:hypothetical protein
MKPRDVTMCDSDVEGWGVEEEVRNERDVVRGRGEEKGGGAMEGAVGGGGGEKADLQAQGVYDEGGSKWDGEGHCRIHAAASRRGGGFCGERNLRRGGGGRERARERKPWGGDFVQADAGAHGVEAVPAVGCGEEELRLSKRRGGEGGWEGEVFEGQAEAAGGGAVVHELDECDLL